MAPERRPPAGALPAGDEAKASAPREVGTYHANGGACVTDGAEVSESAYIGLHATVTGAKVSDPARIEDHASVVDGTVSEDAVVGRLTIVGGGLQKALAPSKADSLSPARLSSSMM